MTDLSKRIVSAWLKANPEPSRENRQRYAEWWSKNQRLGVLLHYKAYESAVLQFLVPDRYKRDIALQINLASVDMGGKDYKAYLGGHKSKGSGRCFAEALFNATEASLKATKPLAP